ncbi:flagellar FliL protein [Enterobacter sp. BIGb0383]|uniref:flagellar basal body-associated protein FliL n=1 Tax=unclassified Enterobacter TaxID=2608935 RepID=UPI000F460F08|nr:flagellar FliL protein [Enterobacter sp. BIGb0383]ROS06778.1 flagellar FliL protein [Enterobacter sp. BIGb0359]
MILAILALGVLAGYAFYQIKNMKSEIQSEIGQSTPVKKSIALPPPIYVPLDTFTVSLKSGATDSDRVLYIGLTLRLKDEGSKMLLQQFMPEIRSRLLMLFSQQTVDVLETDNGKVELMSKIKDVVNLPLADQHSVMVSDVLFNAFILR